MFVLNLDRNQRIHGWSEMLFVWSWWPPQTIIGVLKGQASGFWSFVHACKILQYFLQGIQKIHNQKSSEIAGSVHLHHLHPSSPQIGWRELQEPLFFYTALFWACCQVRLGWPDRIDPAENRVLSDVSRAIIKPRSSFWMTENDGKWGSQD